MPKRKIKVVFQSEKLADVSPPLKITIQKPIFVFFPLQGSLAILGSYAGILKGNPVGQMSGTGQYVMLHK